MEKKGGEQGGRGALNIKVKGVKRNGKRLGARNFERFCTIIIQHHNNSANV